MAVPGDHLRPNCPGGTGIQYQPTTAAAPGNRVRKSWYKVNQLGYVEVVYLHEMPECDEGPFLKEERHLIDAIAERLGSTIEHLQTEERAHHSEIAAGRN